MYANIIRRDISHEKVDRPFQYRIPPKLEGQIQVGMQVKIPFGAGNYLRKGYVMELTMKPEYDIEKIKEIAGIEAGSVTAESRLIQLAWWLKEHYGSTMNQALKTGNSCKGKGAVSGTTADRQQNVRRTAESRTGSGKKTPL